MSLAAHLEDVRQPGGRLQRKQPQEGVRRSGELVPREAADADRCRQHRQHHPVCGRRRHRGKRGRLVERALQSDECPLGGTLADKEEVPTQRRH